MSEAFSSIKAAIAVKKNSYINTINSNHLIFFCGICFVAHVCSPLLAKSFRTPHFHQVWKIWMPAPSPSLWIGVGSLCCGGFLTMGWVYTMHGSNRYLILPLCFISPITLSPILRVSTIQPLKVLCFHRSD